MCSGPAWEPLGTPRLEGWDQPWFLRRPRTKARETHVSCCLHSWGSDLPFRAPKGAVVLLDLPDHSLPPPNGHSSHALERRPGSLHGDPMNKRHAQREGGSCLQDITETNTQNEKNRGSCCGPNPQSQNPAVLAASSARDLRAQDAHIAQKRGRNTASTSHTDTMARAQGAASTDTSRQSPVTSSRSDVSRPQSTGARAHRQGGLRGPPVQ